MTMTTSFGDLTEDLVMEILLKLPIMDLKRVKLVCKSLNSLINTSEFTVQHSLLLNRQPYSFISKSSFGTHMFSGVPTNLQLQIEGLQFTILCCCEGVVLVSHHQNYALWNPATGEFKPIPFDLDELNSQYYYEDLSVYNCGCGFDSKTNEYKPILFLRNALACAFREDGWDLHDMEIHIYSYKTNKWKIIRYSRIVSLRTLRSVYADGFCHWVAKSIDVVGREVIVSFDISNEVIITTPFPDDIVNTYHPIDCPYPLLFNDSFALVKLQRSTWNTSSDIPLSTSSGIPLSTSSDINSFDIWVLGEYGNKDSWTKLFTIGPLTGIENLLGFWDKTKVFLSDHRLIDVPGTKGFRDSDGKLLLYDTVTRQILELQSIEACSFVLTCRQRLLPISVDDN